MPINGLTAPAPAGVPAEQAPLRAPLFRDIAARLGDGRWVVLDLGTARGSTIAFFGRFRSRLIVADVATAVDELNRAKDTAEAARRLDDLMPPYGTDPIDLVLCWDVLNFLAPPAVTALMQRIGSGLRRGAAAHAFMSYSATHTPIEPGSYVVRGDGDVSGRIAAEASRTPLGYTTAQLQRMMNRYTVVRSVLLRQGLQEYVFRYVPLAIDPATR